MSSLRAAAGPVAATTVAKARRAPLTLVTPQPWHPPRAPFVLLVLGLLIAGLLTLLAVNTALAQNSFVIHDLEQQAAELADREHLLREEVATQESPQRLAERAVALGMVPSGNPVFLRLADGAVLGEPEPAEAPPAPAAREPAPAPEAAAPAEPPPAEAAPEAAPGPVADPALPGETAPAPPADPAAGDADVPAPASDPAPAGPTGWWVGAR
jgi:hypothetical protein